jgi:SAM-dependent methyltransferase
VVEAEQGETHRGDPPAARAALSGRCLLAADPVVTPGEGEYKSDVPVIPYRGIVLLAERRAVAGHVASVHPGSPREVGCPIAHNTLVAVRYPWRISIEQRHTEAKVMIEHQFTEDRLAALYDLFYPPEQRADFAFYLPLILSARSVLDVGCGTGALLRLAREAGHTGRLCGLDPAVGMLNQARRRADIEWVQGDLASVGWERAFDLIVMTGHAFQEFVADDEIRAALAAIRSALADGGRFAFETRNPRDRAWERWATQYSGAVTDATGAVVRCEYRVETPVVGDIVHSMSTFTSTGWEGPEVSRGALRFLAADALAAFLSDADLAIEEQFGDWTGAPLIETSPEIITIARKG